MKIGECDMGVSLKEWLDSNPTIKNKQKLFYNMSRTMNYIHDRDYYIKSFNPKEIEILNQETLSPVQYNTVVRIPKEYKDEIVREDIYNLSFIQVSTYSNIKLEDLKPKFLKENFKRFEQYLPEEDVPYLQGIIERGAGIYYYEYVDKRNEKEISKLSNEVNSNSGEFAHSNVIGMQKSKSTAVGRSMVDNETKKLYGDLVDTKQAAFINFLIFPVSIILLGIILVLILLFYI